MKNSIAHICAKCEGKCCRPPIFLGQRDIDKLKTASKVFRTKIAGEAGFDLIDEGKCPFLTEGVGCSLTEELKPVDCVIFPLAFMIGSNGRLEYFRNKLCPYYWEVPLAWFEEMKLLMPKILRGWTEAEKRVYAKRQTNRLVKI